MFRRFPSRIRTTWRWSTCRGRWRGCTSARWWAASPCITRRSKGPGWRWWVSWTRPRIKNFPTEGRQILLPLSVAESRLPCNAAHVPPYVRPIFMLDRGTFSRRPPPEPSKARTPSPPIKIQAPPPSIILGLVCRGVVEERWRDWKKLIVI